MSGPTWNTGNAAGLGVVATTANFSTAAGVLANDTIIVVTYESTSSGASSKVSSVVDGQGSYTPYAYVWDAGSVRGTTLWVLTGAVSGVHSVTITVSASVTLGYMYGVWSNPAGSVVDIGTNATHDFSSTTSPWTQSTGAATYSNGTVVTVANTAQGSNATSQSGTIRLAGGSLGSGNEIMDETQTGSGVWTPSLTWPAAASGVMQVITLQNLPLSSAILMGQACL